MAQIRPIVFKVTDPFPTVKIGDQIWQAQDLDIDDGGSGIAKIDISYSGTFYKTVTYYTYSAASRIADTIPGWHIPTYSEFQTLLSTVSNNQKALTSTDMGWGTNTSGFNAIVATAQNEMPTTSTTSKNLNKSNGVCYYLSSSMSSSTRSCLGYQQYMIYGDYFGLETSTQVAPVRLIKDS